MLIHFATGERWAKPFAQVKTGMAQHNAVIMSVLCLITAAKLTGDAISTLT